jgi:hypothetical protein
MLMDPLVYECLVIGKEEQVKNIMVCFLSIEIYVRQRILDKTDPGFETKINVLVTVWY